jgi:acyl carrier protein
MTEPLREKLSRGRPVEFSESDLGVLREALREAMAVTLDRPPAEIADDARVFDELGLDSIDVFDLLEQLTERFAVTVNLDELPADVIRGNPGTTFRQFADGIADYFRHAPPVVTPAPPTPGP